MISSFSVRRRVTVLMGVLAILMLGAVSFSRIKIDLLPRFDFPAAGVVTEYPGAAPAEVETLVTRLVEEVMGQVARVKTIQSVSLEERSVVIVQFEWGTDMDYAALQMREKLDLVGSVFPSGCKRPVVAAFDPSALPVMFVAVTGAKEAGARAAGAGTGGAASAAASSADGLVGLTRMGTDKVKKALERVEGVASVSVIGGAEEEVLIAVDRARLAASGVSWLQLSQAVTGASLNLPGGTVNEEGRNLLVRSLGEIEDIATLEDLVVGLRPVSGPTPLGPRAVAAPVLLKDVANVAAHAREPKDVSRLNGEPSIILSVQKTSDANTVAVSRGVTKALGDLAADLPSGAKVQVTMDQADFIGKAVGFVETNAWQGALLAVLILFIFLWEIRSVLVIGLAIPISVIATFALMYFADLTLNLMTVGGLALGVGMLVDNSIVVLENIFRHMEEGDDAVKAAITGTNEVITAISASTFTTVVVFLPVVFVGGIAGTLFKELSLTVAFSLLSSLVVAVTFVPMAAVTLFERGSVRARGRTVLESYQRVVRGALRLRPVVILVAAGVLGLSLLLVPRIGAEFVPSMDRGEIVVNVNLPAGSDLASTDAVVRSVEKIVSETPEARFVTATVGSTGGLRMDVAGALGGGSSIGSVGLKLVDRNKRDRSAEGIARDLKRRLAMVRGGDVTAESVGSFLTLAGIRPVELVISGDDPSVLSDLAARVAGAVKATPGATNVDSGEVAARPEARVTYDRSALAALGLHPAVVAAAVRGAIGGQTVGALRQEDRSLDIVLRYAVADRQGVADVGDFVVATPDYGGGGTPGGVPVTLSQVATVARAEGPSVIRREGGRRIQIVSAAIEGRDLATVTVDIVRRVDEIDFPEGYGYKVEGEQREMRDAFAGLGLAMILAVVLVYMVMAAQFESFSVPLVIMFTIPLAAVGALVALRLANVTLSVPSYIGVIMLAGIVVNNAIVMLDFVGQLRAKGLPRDEAVLTAARHRLRPIVMTTATTILGLIPMAFATLEASELARSLAVTVIGGLTSSTLLTLVVIPVVYTLFDDALVWSGRVFGGRGPRLPGIPGLGLPPASGAAPGGTAA